MKITVLTGAGISVASGLKTFRGTTGVYNDADVARLSYPNALKDSPTDFWKFWGAMRGEMMAASPNAAHYALASLEKRLSPDDQLTVITMNVDGLHQRAGNSRVLELHGSLLHSRCADIHCTRHPGRFYDTETWQDHPPVCNGKVIRPDVVLFGESLAPHTWAQAKDAARYADVFIAVGTSNTVAPACDLVKKPHYKGARTIFVNPEIPLGLRYFSRKIAGKAEDVLPDVLAGLIPV